MVVDYVEWLIRFAGATHSIVQSAILCKCTNINLFNPINYSPKYQTDHDIIRQTHP
jgi:hypothetical protein